MKFSLAFLIALALSGAVNIRASPVRSSNELNYIFNEFLNLMPMEKIMEIAGEYLSNDPEVQAVIDYIHTDDFKKLVNKVESIDDIINFYDYLDDSGLDIYTKVNYLHAMLELPPLVPGKPANRNVRIIGGFSGLIEDIKALLPLDDIKALYYEKLETSAAFAQLIERLCSPKLQKLIDALRANEEFRKIVKFCREAGVNIEEITDLLTTMFGLNFPDTTNARFMRKGLKGDIIDFWSLLPSKEREDITYNYAYYDPEIRKMFDYIQSKEFSDNLLRIEATKEAKEFFAFFEESGFNMYEHLEDIHLGLQLPPYEPLFSLARRTGGLVGYVADIKAIIPTEAVDALHKEKLENSPAFAHFVKQMTSQEFQNLLNALRANKEACAVLHNFEIHGLKFKVIMDLYANVLGIKHD